MPLNVTRVPKTKRKVPDYLLFTDGSHRRRNGKDYASFGCVIVNVKSGHYAEFGGELGEKTNVYAEAAAVHRGLRKAAKVANGEPKTVVVVTDSKLTADAFTKFIPYQWDISKDGDWKTVTGKPVKNQDIYRKTWKLMMTHPELRVRFVHMNSHLNMETQWKEMERKLKTEGVVADKNVSQLFMWLNGRADAIAQKVTLNAVKLDERCGALLRMPLISDIF